MRQPFHASLITLALIAGIDAVAAQSSQQEKPNLNSTKEQAVTRGLAETAQQLPSGVQAQEAKGMLFAPHAGSIKPCVTYWPAARRRL